jgi:hypothetical protein
MDFFNLCNQDVSSCPCLLDSININIYSFVTLHDMIDISDSIIHLPFSISSSTSTSSLSLALLRCMIHHDQVLIDPSSITIMIHTTLCVFNMLMLIIIINSFSSFFLNKVFLVFMTFKMCSYIAYNVCLDE